MLYHNNKYAVPNNKYVIPNNKYAIPNNKYAILNIQVKFWVGGFFKANTFTICFNSDFLIQTL